MVTLNKLILHLENLRDVHDAGELPLFIPVLDDEDTASDVFFYNLEELADVNIMDIEVEKENKRVIYFDFLNSLKLLMIEKESEENEIEE